MSSKNDQQTTNNDKAQHLRLHLALDALQDGQFTDRSPYSQTVRLWEGRSPDLVEDPKFAHCASFNGLGDFIELPGSEQLGMSQSSFTVESWVKVGDADPGRDLTVLGTDELGTAHGLHLVLRDRRAYLGFADSDNQSGKALLPDQWHHLTWTYDRDTGVQQIYVNGHLAQGNGGHTALQGNAIVRIGRSAGGHYFHGRLSNLRIYDTCLSLADIKEDMHTDAPSDQQQNYALDFHLLDQGRQNSIRAAQASTAVEEVTLELVNTSHEQHILLDDLSGQAPSAAHHHLALAFPKGVLSRACFSGANPLKLSTASAADWQVTLVEDDPMEKDVVYLSSKKAALEILHDGRLHIQFVNLVANPWGTAQDTVVTLHTASMQQLENETVVQIARTHLVQILYVPKDPYPLTVGLVGPDQLINDGTTINTLTLAITNPQASDPFYPGSGDVHFVSDQEDPSQLVISLNTNEYGGAGALSSPTAARAIELVRLDEEGVEIPNEEDAWSITPAVAERSVAWHIRPKWEDQVLAGREDLRFKLKNIVTDSPVGNTPIHVHYKNIPGYADGRLKTVVKKQPLVYSDGKIGIGIANPEEALEVNGNAKISGELYIDARTHAVIHYGNRGKLGAATTFDPDRGQNGLWIEASNDDGDECGGIFMNGNTMSIWSPGDNDLLRVYDEDFITGDPKFKIDGLGRVAIGTDVPQARLSIGSWNWGSEGPSEDGTTQLLLSGRHNSGANKGSTKGTYKLKIEGYDNDGNTVYPIWCSDENHQTDFWIKNRPAKNELPTMYFAGNVGIGKDGPQAKLDILANDTRNDQINGPNKNGIRLHSEQPDNHAIIAASVQGGGTGDPFVSFDISGVVGWSVGIDNSDAQKFKIANQWDELSSNTKLTIQQDGKVGIGTTEPAVMLDVHGSVHIKDSITVGGHTLTAAQWEKLVELANEL